MPFPAKKGKGCFQVVFLPAYPWPLWVKSGVQRDDKLQSGF